jgi:hypothetical protein
LQQHSSQLTSTQNAYFFHSSHYFFNEILRML